MRLQEFDETKTIVISNLPYDATHAELEKILDDAGHPPAFVFPFINAAREFIGRCAAIFYTTADCDAALETFQPGYSFANRNLFVYRWVADRAKRPQPRNGAPAGRKRQRGGEEDSEY